MALRLVTGGFVDVPEGSETWSVVVSDYTASAGDKIAADTTDGAILITLPASANPGDTVEVADARGTWDTNSVTINRNGHKIEGVFADFVNNASGTFFKLLYIDSTTGWRVLSSGTRPLNISGPTISGSSYIGITQTATNGTWTGSPTSYSFQWQASDNGETDWWEIVGETSATYTPDSGMENKYLRVQVTADNSNGTSSPAISLPTAQLEVPPFPAGAIAFWKLADLTDATGNGKTLTNNNAATFATGKIGNAAVFVDGSYLSQSSVDLSGLSAFTLSCWINSSMTQACNFFGQYGNAGDEAFTLYMNGGNLALYGYLGGAFIEITNIAPVATGGWAFVCVTYDGGALKCWVNGVLEHTSTGHSGTVQTVSTYFGIGNTEQAGYAYPLDGSIDAAGLWGRALSTEEVAALYNAGTGVEPA